MNLFCFISAQNSEKFEPASIFSFFFFSFLFFTRRGGSPTVEQNSDRNASKEHAHRKTEKPKTTIQNGDGETQSDSCPSLSVFTSPFSYVLISFVFIFPISIYFRLKASSKNPIQVINTLTKKD